MYTTSDAYVKNNNLLFDIHVKLRVLKGKFYLSVITTPY